MTRSRIPAPWESAIHFHRVYCIFDDISRLWCKRRHRLLSTALIVPHKLSTLCFWIAYGNHHRNRECDYMYAFLCPHTPHPLRFDDYFLPVNSLWHFMRNCELVHHSKIRASYFTCDFICGSDPSVICQVSSSQATCSTV